MKNKLFFKILLAFGLVSNISEVKSGIVGNLVAGGFLLGTYSGSLYGVYCSSIKNEEEKEKTKKFFSDILLHLRTILETIKSK